MSSLPTPPAVAVPLGPRPGPPLKAPTEGTEFMEYLKQRAGGTVKHSLRDKEIFTVSSWDYTI